MKTFIIGLIIQSAILVLFYGDRLLHLNEYLFCAAGDGLKSYFNVASHVNHDTSVTELGQISYPFGESIFLEDSMPLLSIILQQSAKLFPSIGHYTTGIINITYFLSLIVGLFFLIMIFARYNLHGLLSALASNGILMLSSQHLLLYPYGHIALAHTAFLPMGIYFLIQFFAEPHKTQWAVAITVNIVFWIFVHAYLGLILLTLTFCFYLLLLILKFKHHLKPPATKLIALQIGVPLLFFFLFFKIFDSHPNRIDLPFIDQHRATVASVILPVESPIKTWLENSFGLTLDSYYRWQRIGSYLGLTSIIVLLWIAIWWLNPHKSRNQKSPFASELWMLLGASFLVLLYSMALPFRFLPDSWLNSIPYLKQFSSFGRFAWAFYFVVSIVALVWIYNQTKEKYQYAAVFAAGILITLEAIPIHAKVSKSGLTHHNPFNLKHQLSSEQLFRNIQSEEYQAIIPLPTFFKFSVPIHKNDSDSAIYAAMVASHTTGIPIMSTYLSRPSVTEAMSIYRALQRPPYKQPIAALTSDTRDFLLIFNHTDTSFFDANERYLLSKASLLTQNQRFALYRLPQKHLITNYLDTIRNFQHHDTIYTSPEASYFFPESWDQHTDSLSYLGKGALRKPKPQWNHILTIPTQEMDSTSEYILSFWYFNREWDQTFNTIFLSETDSTGKTLQWINISGIQSDRLDGWWYYVEQPFKIHGKTHKIHIASKGENKFVPWFVIDELLIRPKACDVYRIITIDGKKYRYKNNVLEAQLIDYE